MKTKAVACSNCKKVFLRPSRLINEANKFGWRQFCSKECRSATKNKQPNLKCSNPTCKKPFKRRIYANTKFTYCSRSCAATVNNKKFPKIFTPIKICNSCRNEFKSKYKYCSVQCKNKGQIVKDSIILSEIKRFFEKKGRIPLKREFHYYHAARNRFGNWNNAIVAAGFTPNPIMFAKKIYCK